MKKKKLLTIVKIILWIGIGLMLAAIIIAIFDTEPTFTTIKAKVSDINTEDLTIDTLYLGKNGSPTTDNNETIIGGIVKEMVHITLPPAKGDRFSYYLNGDVWETDYTYKSKFYLNIFISPQGEQSVWIGNFSMSEKDFIEFMHMIDSIPDIWTNGVTRTAPAGSDDWEVCSFDVRTEGDVDMRYLMNNIKRLRR